MFKKILCILSLLLCVAVFASQFEIAHKNDTNVIAYLYAPGCGYCEQFEPIYAKVANKYSSRCKFIKLNVYSAEGYELARKFNVRYVPYVAILKKNSAREIPLNCILSNSCMDDVIMKNLN